MRGTSGGVRAKERYSVKESLSPRALIAKLLRSLSRAHERRGSHLSPISPTLTSASFPAEFESINSIAGSNAAKTRQAKSGLIPVRCVSRLQSIEQKIQLPASGQGEETSDSRAVWAGWNCYYSSLACGRKERERVPRDKIVITSASQEEEEEKKNPVTGVIIWPCGEKWCEILRSR